MTLKVCQLCAVDFTLKYLLLPLIDGMRGAGWQVTAVCGDEGEVEGLRARGYVIATVAISRGFNPFRHAWSLLRLIALLRREKFDVVHAHTPVAALLGRIAARVAGVPLIVYTAHGFYFHEQMKPLPKAIFTFLEWLGGRCTDLLFTQSEEDAQTAVARGFLPAERVQAIGNGVDVARFNPQSARPRVEMRAELGIPQEAVVVGMIGRMVAEKGYGEFFAAAAGVARQSPQAYFLVIGGHLASERDSGIGAQLERAQAALGPRLILTGMRNDVPDLCAAMDVFTLPSYREGMPRSIIEAMHMGLPVVATDIRGSREEVVREQTGLLVPTRDAAALEQAFMRLIADPGLRSRMGAAGRARALELYDEVKVVARQIAAIRAHLPAVLRDKAVAA
ncbi:MAG TPA: glycosyltransferase family 4 protein [Burkholderiales bacterium]|nr:glycosyltransferase family 4 protein [Burkholderiales bacterium]